MTFREKLLSEKPELVSAKYKGGCKGCPEDYDYEGERYCKACTDELCKECWDREIPVEKEEQPMYLTNQMRRDMLNARSSFIGRFYGDLVAIIGDRGKAYELTKMAFEKGWFG